MKITEYIKKEKEKLREKTPKERREYLWDYYKWPILGVVLAVVLLVQGVISIHNRKEIVFSGIMLNCKIDTKEDAFLNGFYELAGIDAKKETASFYTDIILQKGQNQLNANSFQRIMAGIVVKDTDFIAGTTEPFQLCAYSSGNMLVDLRSFLDAETMTKLEGRLYYIDKAVWDQINAPLGEHVEPDLLTYPDPHKPEDMVNPIPVGIDVSNREAFVNAYYLPNSRVYIGIVPNTTRQELVLDFIDYLLEA